MKPCPRCGEPNNVTAAFCQRCGLPFSNTPPPPHQPYHQPKRNDALWFAILGCLVVITIALIFVQSFRDNGEKSSPSASGRNNRVPSKPNTPRQVITITPDRIYAMYDENPLKAEKELVGKWLRFKAPIDGIGGSMKERRGASLMFMINTGSRWESVAVFATFDDEWKERISTLKEGDEVEVEGFFKGKAEYFSDMYTMEHCELKQ